MIDGREYPMLRENGYMSFVLPAGEREVKLVLSEWYEGASAIKVREDPEVETFVRVVTWNEMNGACSIDIFACSRKRS